MGSGSKRVYEVVLWGLALLWVATLFHAFAPGLMSPDSVSQYAQGLTGRYSNAHPPFMSWLLGLSGKLAGSPWPFLMAQLLSLGVGFTLLARRARTALRRWALLVLVAALVVPPTWSLAVVLWKDSALAGVMLLVVWALAARRLGLAALFMVSASLLRHNAIIALVPLLIFAMGQVEPLRRSRLRRAAGVVAATAALALCSPLIERLSRAEDTCMLCMPALLDLSAVYVDSPELFPNSAFADQVTIDDLRATYTPATMIFILYGDDQHRRVNPDFVVSHRRAILAEWLSVVPQRPGAYVRSRLAFFAHLLGLHADVFYPFQIGIDENPWGLWVWQADTALHLRLRDIQEATRSTIFFRGWLWLGVSVLACLGLAWRKRGSLALYTALSGTLFTLTLLVLAPSADFRYLYWTIVSTFATTLLLLEEPSPMLAGDDSTAPARA